jgi:hypothetical protein
VPSTPVVVKNVENIDGNVLNDTDNIESTVVNDTDAPVTPVVGYKSKFSVASPEVTFTPNKKSKKSGEILFYLNIYQ